jgi:RHS repeat-associated protein
MLAAKQSPVSNPEKKLFYHNDHLGGVNVITDITGVKVQLNEYDPWGKVSRTEGNVDPEKRFTGQILDPESGLYYYGARYYDPELARFISPDPIVPSPGDPQTLNRYSYVRNNPVRYIDPSGMSFWSAIANFFKGFFRSVPALVTGIAVGWATWGAGPILAGILGGVTAAVVNTAINGGSWGQAIGMGAVLGGIAGGIGGDVFKGFGGIPADKFSWGNFVAGIKTGAAFGAVIGGISTAIHGGNVFQNVALGALSGAVSSAAAFGIMKGATEAYAAGKDWWNSMPGAEATNSGGPTMTVRVVSRPMYVFGLRVPFASHDMIQILEGGEGLGYDTVEMGPHEGKATVFRGDLGTGTALLPNSKTAIDLQTLEYGNPFTVNKADFLKAVDMAAQTYTNESRNYNPFFRNSNHFVDFVVSSGGGAPVRAPGVWSPGFSFGSRAP